MNTKIFFQLTILLILSNGIRAQNPGGVTGFAIWFAANSGVSPATTGSTVTNWNCNNCSNNLSQTYSGYGPVYNQKLINFNPCLTYTNNNPASPSNMEGLSNTTSFNEQTGFVVQRLDSTIHEYTGIVRIGGISDNMDLGRAFKAGSTYKYSENAGGNDFSNGSNQTYVDGAMGLGHHYRWHICRVIRNNNIPKSPGSGIAIGFDSDNTRPSIGDIAETTIFPSQLSNIDINRVESYLAIKYGITLNQTAPGISYRSSNYTIIWDSTNAPYNQNITGIGRDDASGLDQRQSLSIDSVNSIITIYNGNVTSAPPVSNIANTNSFAADQSFDVLADNGNTINALSVCYNGGQDIGVARIWKVQKTGTVNTVTLSAPAADFPSGTTQLLVSDNDPAFAQVNTTAYTLTNTGGILSAAVTLQNNNYFTFAAPVIISITHTDAICLNANNGSAIVHFSSLATPSGYLWNTTPAQTKDTATGLTPGFYSVTVTFFGGCTITDSVTIHHSGNIAFPIVASTGLSCFNINTGISVITATGGNPPYEYTLGTNPHQENDTFKNLSIGTYNYVVTDTFGCTNSGTFTINGIAFNFSVTTTPGCINIGTGTSVITVTGGIAPYMYNLFGTAMQANDTFKNLFPGKYLFYAADTKGCTNVDSFKIDSALLKLSVTTTSSCISSPTGTFTVSVSGGKNPYTYSLNNELPIPSGSYTNLTQGIYTILVTDSLGCITNDTASINSIILSDQKNTIPSCSVGATGSLYVNAFGGQAPYKYAVYTEPSGHVTDSNYIVPISAGIYRVTITDQQGCVLKDTITVKGESCCNVMLPNAFSPNNDGLNDNFKGISSGALTSYLLNIYDRWGNLVFSSNDVNDAWNGTYKGQKESVGVYVYYVKAICATGTAIEKKGDVTLVR